MISNKLSENISYSANFFICQITMKKTNDNEENKWQWRKQMTVKKKNYNKENKWLWRKQMTIKKTNDNVENKWQWGKEMTMNKNKTKEKLSTYPFSYLFSLSFFPLLC